MFVWCTFIILQVLVVRIRSGHFRDLNFVLVYSGNLNSRYSEIVGDNSICQDKDLDGCEGGYCRMYQTILDLQKKKNVVVINTGNTLGGSVLWKHHGVEGAVKMAKYLGRSYTVLGSHEMYLQDKTVEYLTALKKIKDYPVPTYLGSNLHFPAGSPFLKFNIQRSTIVEFDRVKIGLVGFSSIWITQTTQSKKAIMIEDELAAVRLEVKSLDQNGVDVIIVYGFANNDVAKELVFELPMIDIVVTGGISGGFYGPNPEGDPLVFPADASVRLGHRNILLRSFGYTKYLGIMEFKFQYETLMEYSGGSIQLTRKYKTHKPCVDEIDSWYAQPTRWAGYPVDRTILMDNVRIPCSIAECSMGDRITDAVHIKDTKESHKLTNFVVISSIDITSGINASTQYKNAYYLTYIDLWNTVSHDVELTKFYIKGTKLLEMLEELLYVPTGIHFLQVSGLNLQYDLSFAEDHRVVELYIRCADCPEPIFYPLQASFTYTCIISRHLIYDGLIPNLESRIVHVDDLNFNMFDALLDYFEGAPIRDPEDDFRIKINTSDILLANKKTIAFSAVVNIFVLFTIYCY